MARTLDPTHDPSRRSWVASANDGATDYPIQNLPFGVFRRKGDDAPRIGVAIGDRIFDARAAVEERLLDAAGGEVACALSANALNDLMGQGTESWSRARHAIGDLLDDGNGGGDARLREHAARDTIVFPARDAEMLLPARIGDYTDFYSSIHHATNVGSMFRPDNPLMPNYKHLPVGYHGRASSIVPSGTSVRRPHGQALPAGADAPSYAPCRLLDYELEMGFLTGPGNAMGTPVSMSAAPSHIFGMAIVNDWSARDIQKWEYQPLGPFNAKNFMTSMSPWVVTLDALEPYRVAGEKRGPDDPPVLDYLAPVDDMGFSIELEVSLSSPAMRDAKTEPFVVSRGNFRHMYWSIAQMLAHHTSTGCNLRPGDLMASGTVSGPERTSAGCLLERTWRGEQPLTLPDGTERKFLQDGDEVVMKAWCTAEGRPRLGFGSCAGVVIGA